MRTGHEPGSHHWNNECKYYQVDGDVGGPCEINRGEQMHDEDSQEGFESKQTGGIERVVNQIKRKLNQPFVVDPGMALCGKGKRIGVVHPTLLPDILSETDMAP